MINKLKHSKCAIKLTYVCVKYVGYFCLSGLEAFTLLGVTYAKQLFTHMRN